MRSKFVSKPFDQSRLPAGLSKEDVARMTVLFTTEQKYVKNNAFLRKRAETQIYSAKVEVPGMEAAVSTILAGFAMGYQDPQAPMPAGQRLIFQGDEEKTAFLQYNYARMRIVRMLRKLGNRRPNQKFCERILYWDRTAEQIRNTIWVANVFLVKEMAKKMGCFAHPEGIEAHDEGWEALNRAIKAFNVAFGLKFSTYACSAIIKSISRYYEKYNRRVNLIRASYDPKMDDTQKSLQDTGAERDHQENLEILRSVLESNEADLTDVEKEILQHRFALGRADPLDDKGLTLEEIGKIVGVTKERVRQIQNKALSKLKVALEGRYVVV